MCTITGAAGNIAGLPSKSRQEFHEFMTCLFTMGELRGRDAAGFWAWRGDHYVYEKRPIPAQDLAHRSMAWKSLRFNPASLYITHTRSTTDGDPNVNCNNHPHIGEHTVMVHNGCVWNYESIARGFKFDMKTDCDSEILQRLVERDEDIVEGFKSMYRVCRAAHGMATIAVAFVDRRDPTRIILSRNSGNPLNIYECPRLGCTFFCSTEDIFEYACMLMYGEKDPKKLGFKQKDVATETLYYLNEDGTVEAESLGNFHQSPVAYQGSTTGGSTGGASTTATHAQLHSQSQNAMAYANIFGTDFELDIRGNLKPFALELDDDDDEQQESSEGEDIMPELVKEDLISFLEAKV